MNNFFKTFFACLLAILASSIISVLFGIIFIAALVGSAMSSSESVTLKANTVIRIDLGATIVDKASANPFDNIDIAKLKSKKTMTLLKAVSLIETAKADPSIAGIYLDIPMEPATSITTLYELREAITDFRKSGKFVISYADVYSQGGYYMATCADKIYLNPQGAMQWSGLSMPVIFYKGLFDKLGIEPEIIRHGKFKGAVEPFMMTKLSDENRLQLESLAGSMWGYIVSEVAKSRSLDSTQLQQYASLSSVQFASDALKYSFVDQLMYREAVIKELGNLTQTNEPHTITLAQYGTINPSATSGDILSKNKVAVLYANGEIMDQGDSNTQIIGNTLASQLAKLRADDKIKAVVLRVNSPGGSVLASDIIWHEVELTRKSKPVIVSMGEYAASGGYYISCPADEIIAAPTTLTGSIGVFGIMLNIEKGAREKLGVTADIIKTNPMADLGNMFRPLTTIERKIMQDGVDSIYIRFVTLVAQGRSMKYDQVDEIAQGRVWSGIQGIENHLVDRIGTMRQAIESAAEKAALQDYKVEEFPKTEENFMEMFNSIMESSVKLAKGYMGITTDPIKQAKEEIKKQAGIKAKMPYEITINN